MSSTKPFINIDKQIERLKKRGLEIQSDERTKRQLIKTSYYDLINGYKNMFLDKENSEDGEEKFIQGTKFDDLTRLHALDRELRHIVMRATLDVECNFYTTIAYCISEKFGEKQEDYLKKENYRRGVKQSKKFYERDNLLYLIHKKMSDPQENPMKYYHEKYGNIPPWILVKHLSFGNLIVWYKVSPVDVKDNIIRNFTGLEPNDEIKEFFLKSMELYNKFRNRAAHGGRIYNFHSNIQIPYNSNLHETFYISKDQYDSGRGRSDMSAFILSLLFIYQKDYFGLIEQMVYLHNNLNSYNQQSPLNYDQILFELGFPVDYYTQIMDLIIRRKHL